MNGLDQAERSISDILEERARALGRVPTGGENADTVELLLFDVAGECHGVRIDAVRAIEQLGNVTRVPGVPGFWLGVANVRSSLFPVLDLAAYLSLAATEPTDGSRIVLVADGGLVIGLFVDEVAEIRRVSPGSIRPLTGGSRSHADAYEGVTSDMVSVIDVGALLSAPSLQVDQAISR